MITTKFQVEENAGKKSRVTRKHVIIVVTCAVILAMVIAGILVGVKFHLDNTHEIVTVSTPQYICFSENISIF